MKTPLLFSALESLINFAYSGRVLINNNNVQNLMLGAAFLQLNSVREACARHLIKEWVQAARGRHKTRDASGHRTPDNARL